MVNKNCMMTWLAYKCVPMIYRNIIADAAVASTNVSMFQTKLQQKGIPAQWWDEAKWCYYKCGGT